MRFKQTSNAGIFSAILFLTAHVVLAAPTLQILSPQNTNYNATQILVNVTSNEPVTFYLLTSTGKKLVLEDNASSFVSYLYLKNGSYSYTIWANNSNGTVNQTVLFNSTMHNPVNITTCGQLFSSDTDYIITNDINDDGRRCFYIDSVRGFSVNLNNKVINTSGQYVFYAFISDIRIFNGTLRNQNGGVWGDEAVLVFTGNKVKLTNVLINGHVGVYTLYPIDEVIFENVTFNASIGFWNSGATNTYFINSSFVWNGFRPDNYGYVEPPAAINDFSSFSTIILENTTFKSYPEYDFYFGGLFFDAFLRSTKINTSKIRHSPYPSTERFFKQHLVIVNLSDQRNSSGSGVVQAIDNGILPRRRGYDATLSTQSNPTADILIPAENGKGETWLTENLILTISSKTTEYDFSPYNLTSQGWGSSTKTTQNITLTGLNSTIHVDIQLNVSLEEALPSCNITQMLDLNGDNNVTIQDALLVLRKITGQQISVNATKTCEGINLNPF